MGCRFIGKKAFNQFRRQRKNAGFIARWDRDEDSQLSGMELKRRLKKPILEYPQSGHFVRDPISHENKKNKNVYE